MNQSICMTDAFARYFILDWIQLEKPKDCKIQHRIFTGITVFEILTVSIFGETLRCENRLYYDFMQKDNDFSFL